MAVISINGIDILVATYDYAKTINTTSTATNSTVSTVNSTVNTIEQEVYEIEEHVHNRARWIGSGATEDSLTAYQVQSGNGAYGPELAVLAAGNTPIRVGMAFYDPHNFFVESFSAATTYYMRFVWGDGTFASALVDGQYTVTPARATGVGAGVRGTSREIIIPRLSAGVKLWAQCKNATLSATVDFFVGIHEYER